MIILLIALLVCTVMGGTPARPTPPPAAAGPVTPECTLERTKQGHFGGLYVTDGTPGIDIETYVLYANLTGNRVHICEIGVRFPAPSRVTHCVPPGAFCPPGSSVLVDFDLPLDTRDQFVFQSIGFGINKQGHPNGNYQEYREYQITQGNPPSTFSWSVPHVDAHFFHVKAEEVAPISWNYPMEPTPDLIERRCACEPDHNFVPSGFYSENDCVPGMGRHFSQDKLETVETFQSSPALIAGTYNCKPFFWEPMVTDQTLEWVRDNGVGQQATISFPQPHDYYWSAEYPSHYGIAWVTDEAKKIGGGDTYAISLKRFVRRPGTGPRNAGIDV